MKTDKRPTMAKLLYEHIRRLTRQDPACAREISRVHPGNAQTIGAREEQQDAFGFSEIGEEKSLSQTGVLAVLADGMGGLQMGREAAHLAVQTMLKEFAARRGAIEFSAEPVQHTLWHILEKANSVVYETARQQGLALKVGTTLAAAAVLRNELFWVSVGDSRIYLYRDHELSQLNVEHIYGRELDRKALHQEITWEEAQAHRDREALTSYVGMPELCEVDRNLKGLPLRAGDWIMLCSDGVYRALSIEEIKEELAGDPAEAAESLIRMVIEKEKAGQDNATVAILACE
ncbi:MAG TPA: serine/threonine-protein phosphatase [Firmicutes bacterium]|nr:serine/threonine-protein phosphatase [Bacillota bacterium]